MTFKAPTTPEIGGAGRVSPFRNLCRLCHFKICTGLAQTKIQKSVQISDLHSATQSAQQKPLILLGEMHFCANLSYISLVGLKNIKVGKNSVENFKTRARRRVHTRYLLPRARARYSIRRNFTRRADGSRQRRHQPHWPPLPPGVRF